MESNNNAPKRDKGTFKFKNFSIRHDLCGMKVGTDAVLLTGYLFFTLEIQISFFLIVNIYASLDGSVANDEVWKGIVEFNKDVHIAENVIPNNKVKRILEIGCGSGVITLLLADR